MKTITTFLLSITFLPQVLCAQPTVTINEFYNVGDVINMVNVNPPSVAMDIAGAGVTWDFSMLSASGGNSITTVANNTSGTFGTSNLMITLPNGEIEFMSEGSLTSAVNGIYYPATHDTISYNAYIISKRPFTYPGYYLDTYKIDAASPLIMGNGSLVITGDAYGTLKTPTATYTNVLRIKKFQEETDTVGGTDAGTVTTTKYQWFDAAHSTPLFEVDSITSLAGNTTTAMYLASTEGVSYLNAASQFNYTGYIQNDELQLTGTFDNGRTYDVVIYSVIGTKIYTGDFTASGNTQRIDMGSDVKPGIYIVSLTQSNNSSYSQVIKVVKQ